MRRGRRRAARSARSASQTSAPSARRWLRAVIPGASRHDRRRAPAAASAARSSAGRSRSRRPRPAAAASSPRPARATLAGADSERRRLSSIFQRPISGSALRCRSPAQRRRDRGSTAAAASRRAPSGAGARRRRRSATGNSSTTSMSETRPARAKMPSNRSWLSSVLSGHAAGERGLEGIDVVDALAGVGAFAEEVLIDVRHGGGVGIDAARAGEDALEERALAADRQRRRDARLQHAVALDDAAASRHRSAAG